MHALMFVTLLVSIPFATGPVAHYKWIKKAQVVTASLLFLCSFTSTVFFLALNGDVPVFF
jgi:hypothetical protein